MLTHYLKSAVRNLLRQKRFSFINIFGLALGMAICLLVYVFVQYETSFEKSFQNYENIHRLTALFTDDEDEDWLAVTPYPLAPAVAAKVPEVIAATRLEAAWKEHQFKYNNVSSYLDNFAYVDTSFFKVFSYEFTNGNSSIALSEPNNIVLSENMATQFFGKQNPIGQLINFNNDRDLKVVGIFKKPVSNSHIDFDIFIPWRNRNSGATQWNNMLNYYSYVKLHSGTEIKSFEQKMNQVVQSRFKSSLTSEQVAISSEEDLLPGVLFASQPIKDIHLHSHLDGEIGANSYQFYMLIYLMVGFAILFIAIINFTNLSTARSASRAKEVGVRKVVGASRWESSIQFLIESILQSIVALILAFLLAEIMLPYFNGLLDLELTILKNKPILMIGFGIILAILVGLVAGIYPALFLSGFSPIKVLTGDFSKSKESAPLRKGLVISQFSICATLILFLGIVFQQLNYITSKSLGFNPEQIMVISLQNSKLQLSSAHAELSKIPGIKKISFANRLPGEKMGGNQYQIGARSAILDFNRVDQNFIDALDIKLTTGNFFTKTDIRDSIKKFVVNESFVSFYNIKNNPIGQRISNHDGVIIGVVEDFHWQGFNESITPFVMQELDDPYLPKTIIKISSENLPQTVKAIQKKWATLEPGYPFRYSFLDADFGALFKGYQNFGKALGFITILIVFTAALGLFGLAAYTAEQRNKEIGIRKVLGASVSQIMILITKDFMYLVLIAAVVALPVGYLIAKKWLTSFAYQTQINAFPFVATIITLIAVSLLTVSWQAYRAASINPVNAIKKE